MRGGRRGAVGAYPNPWFDLSSTYIPSSYKELFRWCQYLYTSHSEIAPIVNKKCSYVITRIIYDTTQTHAKKLWKEVLEKICTIRRMEFMLLLDLEVYGNAFASIYYPFERYLECPACGQKQEARRHPWTYVDFKFVSTCAKCERKGAMKATDKTIHSRIRTRVLRWNPQYVAIRHNPLTDKREYVYQIPKWIRQRVQNKNINRVLVEDTPLEFLDAIEKRKNVLFSPTNIYHFHNPAPSGEDDAFGMPPMMPIFKDAWLFQVYKRAQEAVAMEHVLPLTLLIPQPIPGASPHASTNLGEWSRKMMEVVALWRRDQNSIYTTPFPLTVQNVRGDAAALSVHNELNMVRQEIAGGLDVPQEFVYGGLNWTGSSISLRVLENLFLGRIEQLNDFLNNFVIPKLQRFLSLPNVEIRHADFKMADDAQQKQIALNLRATNTISDRTTIEELGFDAELEKRRKKEEAEERDLLLVKQMMLQAEAQGQALSKQTEYQLKAQQMMQSDLSTQTAQAQQTMRKTGAVGGSAAAASLPRLQLADNPVLTDMLVERFLKGPGSPDDKRFELMQLQAANPRLVAAIKDRMRAVKSQGNDKFMKPLPEQKPPRRANSPV